MNLFTSAISLIVAFNAVRLNRSHSVKRQLVDFATSRILHAVKCLYFLSFFGKSLKPTLGVKPTGWRACNKRK
jgi:hypothetical protein